MITPRSFAGALEDADPSPEGLRSVLEALCARHGLRAAFLWRPGPAGETVCSVWWAAEADAPEAERRAAAPGPPPSVSGPAREADRLRMPLRSSRRTVGVLEVLCAPAGDPSEALAADAAAFAQFVEARAAAADASREAAEARRVAEELQMLVYAASHDLQEPLRMVTSYCQLLDRKLKGQLDPTAQEFLAFAVDGAARMNSFIRDLLAFSRVATRGAAAVPTDASRAFDAALGNLRETVTATGAQVSRGPLPTVLADPAQLAQLFTALLDNALKFRAPGRPPVVAATGAETGDGWRFEIADNGIGLDPASATRLFRPFQRLVTRAEYPGSGMGLATCRRIVERHGGRIGVEPAPGGGSRFWFTLPRSSPVAPRHL
jgi:light-regulated signal transduction histidine kinase (bacteriophytochrome)